MTKARILANLISDNAELADGQISVAEVVGAAPLASPTFTGTTSGTFSGPLTGNVTGNLTGDVTGAVTGDVTAPEIDLSAISSTISDTAVDVFVYRTANDSDGGSWRKRTQNTSWYNEALNTATRGSRKEFPAVAVIVAESSQVTIYDGDDPDLPMWMVFTAPDTNPANYAIVKSPAHSISSTIALNGIIATSVSFNGLFYQNFVSDNCYRVSTSSTIQGGNIASRNGGMNFSNTVGSYGTVNAVINDVAMTVLPNAPIDAATGLPVPTIAVATAGGVSVITDSGAVYDSSYTSAHSSVNIYEDRLSFGYTSFDNVRFVNISEITADGWTGTDYSDTTTPAVFGSNAKVTASNAISNAAGLNFLAEDPTPANGMVAYTTSTYNTGWMNGDIKLATLSDTDTANVVGSNLISNGTFSNTTGWTALNATISIDSNRLKVADNGGYTKAYASFATVVGKTYTVSVEVAAISGQSAVLAMGHTTPSGSAWNTQTTSSSVSPTTLSITRTATHTTMYVELGSEGTNFAIFDNVEARIAEEDRSVNGNGLQVFGTVTKTAVATGADLVGYSGFSASNYLQQPYNSDLDFGTGDFSFMVWLNMSNNAQTGIVFHRSAKNVGDAGFGGSGPVIQAEFNGASLYGLVATDAFNTAIGVQIPYANFPNGVWTQYALVRSNGILSAYLNGKLYVSVANSLTTTNTSAKLYVGERPVATRPLYGKMALYRFSATAPSPEQIAKIYEDEKHLFQTGAQATLYAASPASGSPDAVTALAYDDTTDLLHVGTDNGRSVFQGLRRVDNTTDAVGAAISASNGLVAED